MNKHDIHMKAEKMNATQTTSTTKPSANVSTDLDEDDAFQDDFTEEEGLIDETELSDDQIVHEENERLFSFEEEDEKDKLTRTRF